MAAFIHEFEPLNWLVSSLFTDEFYDYRSMTPSIAAMLCDANDSPYQNQDELDAAIDEFIIGHADASNCLVKAKLAIENNIIETPEIKINEWGETIGIDRSNHVHSFDFFIWAENEGYPIRSVYQPLIEPMVQMALSHREHEKNKAHFYPPITREQFDNKMKEPLWKLGSGILYLMGKRYRLAEYNREPVFNHPKIIDYIKSSDFGEAVLKYAFDAYKSHQLNLIVDIESDSNLENILFATIKPLEFIDWFKTLPLMAPIFAEDAIIENTAYITPDMRLMYDAVEKFWSNYDLNSPNPNIAPFKKDVVAWLMSEAEKRNIQDFSESRAKVMDTIIRCPKSRGGGSTL
jgi:hypothetical protein